MVAHALVVIIWHILATGKPYHELGADYFTTRLDPERETRRLIAKLEAWLLSSMSRFSRSSCCFSELSAFSHASWPGRSWSPSRPGRRRSSGWRASRAGATTRSPAPGRSWGTCPVRGIRGRRRSNRVDELCGGGPVVLCVDVLGRYGFERDILPRHPPVNLRVTFRSVHGSKGLEANYIVIPGVTTGTYGLPSTIADDPVLDLPMPASTRRRSAMTACF